MNDATRRELGNLLRDLLDNLQLMPSAAIRLYNAIEADFGSLAEAVDDGHEWVLQLIDRRYARWPAGSSGWPRENAVFDTASGTELALLPERPVESVAYDLAEMARRRERGRKDANRTQGGGAAVGVRRGTL